MKKLTLLTILGQLSFIRFRAEMKVLLLILTPYLVLMYL